MSKTVQRTLSLAKLVLAGMAAAWALGGFSAAPLLVGQAAAEVPAPPSGYASPDEVKQAVLSGKVKLINMFLPVPEGVEVTKDVEYGTGGSQSLKLDLYAPKRVEKPVPGLIFIHGGAWKGGNRNDYRYYCIKLAERGYVVATISYRLTQDAPFPAAVEDAKCAVRWMRANAGKLQVDPDKIGVAGGSAGGHLALMVAYCSDVLELEGSGGHAGVSSRVQAVVDLYGPADLTTSFATGNPITVDFLGGKTYQEVPKRYALASPIKHVTKDDPPTLILHGTIDTVVPIGQSDALARKLKETGIAYRYDRLKGWPHTMDLAEDVNRRCRYLMSEFFDRHLPLPNRAATHSDQ